MKRSIIFFLQLVICISLKSQKKALTENGREVILYDNGTWIYTPDNEKGISKDSNAIATNPNKFFKPADETFIVKSNVMNVGVYMDHSLWTFRPHKENEVNPEYLFSLKSGKGYAMIITERTEIDLVNLKDVVLRNAQNAAPDARIVSAEYRIVNDNKVLCLKFKATMRGIRFVYFGYYFSSSNGTVQVVAYSSDNLFDETRNDLEKFLNGFSVLN